jgi:protein TIF31
MPSVTAINNDLRNLGVLLNLEIKDLQVLHMVLIEYRGHRIIAQCIIPGILSADQLQCSQYGSIDDGKTINTNEEF